VTSYQNLPKSLFGLSFRHRWWARLGIFLTALLGALAGIAAAVFQKIFIDQVMATEALEIASFNFVHVVGFTPVGALLGAFVATVVNQGISLLCNFFAVREGAMLQRIFSEALYRKTLSIRTASLGTTTVGEIVSIYATDVPGGTAVIDQVLPMAAVIISSMILGPLAVYWVCGIPMWATLSLMAVVIAFTLALAIRQSRFFWRFKQLAAERTGIVNEWVQSIRLLRILGWIESFERKIFLKRQEETANRVTMVTNGQFMNAFGSSISFIINLAGVASLMYLSGRRVSPGELFAMLWIFGVFLQRAFRQLPWFFTLAFDSATSLRRLERFLARPSDAGLVERREQRELVFPAALPLRVRGLDLAIDGHKILNDVSFDLRAGELVAVVGEVGSGKSMLALSLVGETGATFKGFQIGPIDALQLDVNERRRYFSFVPQEGFVMSASLRENIVFHYDPSAENDNRVSRALELAQFKIEEELQGPGLETEIGERGLNLSGGQRQRVSLARAHQFNRPIILLDDCLSAVDVDTERQLVRDLLNGAWRSGTRLLVTHRLSILSLVDRVLFMEKGSLVEQGAFAELLKKSQRMQEFVASVKRNEENSTPVALPEGDGAGMEANVGTTVESSIEASNETLS
jgi:ABC-type multidrug transport system fused ATPase/permease subunit